MIGNLLNLISLILKINKFYLIFKLNHPCFFWLNSIKFSINELSSSKVILVNYCNCEFRVPLLKKAKVLGVKIEIVDICVLFLIKNNKKGKVRERERRIYKSVGERAHRGL